MRVPVTLELKLSVSEAASLTMAQSWPWGSQIAAKKILKVNFRWAINCCKGIFTASEFAYANKTATTKKIQKTGSLDFL